MGAKYTAAEIRDLEARAAAGDDAVEQNKGLLARAERAERASGGNPEFDAALFAEHPRLAEFASLSKSCETLDYCGKSIVPNAKLMQASYSDLSDRIREFEIARDSQDFDACDSLLCKIENQMDECRDLMTALFTQGGIGIISVARNSLTSIVKKS